MDIQELLRATTRGRPYVQGRHSLPYVTVISNHLPVFDLFLNEWPHIDNQQEYQDNRNNCAHGPYDFVLQ